MSKLIEKETEFPIFDAILQKDLIIISGGGGGQKFGIPNTISLFHALTFDKKYSIDTNEDLIEKLFSCSELDTIIGISENQVSLFEITTKNELKLIDKKTIFEKASTGGFVSKLIDMCLIIFDHETSKLITFSLENKKLKEVFSTHLDEKIHAIQKSSDKNVIYCIFADKVLAFNLETRKFVERAFVFPETLTKISTFYESTTGALGILDFKNMGIRLTYLKPNENNKLLLSSAKSQSFPGHQAVCSGTAGGFLAIGTVEGAILFFWREDDDHFRHFSTILAHQMPVRSLILKLSSNECGSKKDLIVSTFGTDSKMKCYLVQQPSKKNISFVKIVLTVLFLSILLRWIFQAL